MECKRLRCGGCRDVLYMGDVVQCKGCWASFARYYSCYYEHQENAPENSPCRYAGRDPPVELGDLGAQAHLGDLGASGDLGAHLATSAPSVYLGAHLATSARRRRGK